MDMVRHILMLLESQPLITHQWRMLNVRPLPKNSGIMFRVNANLFDGLVKIRYNPTNSKYIISYIPFDRIGVVIEQRHVEEKDLIGMLAKQIGQSVFSMDYLVNMFLMFRSGSMY